MGLLGIPSARNEYLEGLALLLRSLSHNLRSQNWTAVLLDLLIVIVGVFIGIQAANWNEEQADRESIEQLLARLEIDLSAASENLRSMDQAIDEQKVALDALLAGLEQGKPVSADAARAGASRWAAVEFVPPPPASFAELIATGRTGLIESVSLREEVRRVAELSEATRNYNEIKHTFINPALDALAPYLRKSRAPQHAGHPGRSQSRDLELIEVRQLALWDDEQARQALYNVYEYHSLTQRWVQSNLFALSQLHEQIIQRHSRSSALFEPLKDHIVSMKSVAAARPGSGRSFGG